jgi:cell shape-determining protein MreC
VKLLVVLSVYASYLSVVSVIIHQKLLAMTDLNKILGMVTIAMLVVLLYFVFTGNGKLNDAVKTLNDVSAKVKVVNDSLHNAQQSIEGVMKKLEFSENELRILKANRDLLELEEQKKKANDWNELQDFKAKIKKNESTKDSLIDAAKKFDI